MSEEIKALLEQHLNGDADAWMKLIEPHRSDLWGYLVNHVPNHADAEDLYQDVNMKVMGNLGNLKDPSRLRSWLFSIAMNSVRSFFRKKRPVAIEETRDSMVPVWSGKTETPIEQLEKRERINLMKHCIKQLPDRDRDVLLLDVMAEMPQKEIAEELGLNINTVKTITRRAKIKLARMMAEVSHG